MAALSPKCVVLCSFPFGFACLTAATCNSYYGFDNSVYNAVQGSDNWIEWFGNPDANLIGGINTAYAVGAIITGFFFGGPVADFFGRKIGMLFGSVLVILGTFLEAFSPRGNVGCFIAGRVVIGMGQGLALSSGPTYIGEICPAKIRGTVMTFWQVAYSVGMFFCFWINFACNKHKETLGQWDWRMVVIFQILCPCILLVLIPMLPETPRWHIKRHGDIESARRALQLVRETEKEVEDEIVAIRQAIEFEKTAISSSYSALWKDPSVRKRVLLAMAMNAGQQLTGQGSLSTYSTKVYEKVFKSSSTIALINALNATFAIPFTLNVTWTVERFGRKFLFIVGGIGMGMCMVIAATVETQTPTHDGAKTESVGIAIVFLLFLFIFFYKPSWGAVTWIWSSEIFSMNVRAQGVGMAGQTQNITNAIVQQFFPLFLQKCGFYAFYMFAGLDILLATFVFFCIPETKGVSMEEMDTLFGGVSHVEKGSALLHLENAAPATPTGSSGVELQEDASGRVNAVPEKV
ncbi:MAG: hypothetical protein M1834_007368 [Cirrosporium novae-zelandiae]|nr:MAG: hypothetical protein M1834_007368 [Cirrosporium novae-zelandiae]